MSNARLVENYCTGCKKIEDNRCTVYANPIAKTAADRGGHIGCAFSPCEFRYWYDHLPVERKRIGQQKQRRRR